MRKRQSRRQPGSDHGLFGEWLRSLPSDVATSAENGHPIRVNDPGTEHGRKLVRALGAQIIEAERLRNLADLCDQAIAVATTPEAMVALQTIANDARAVLKEIGA